MHQFSPNNRTRQEDPKETEQKAHLNHSWAKNQLINAMPIYQKFRTSVHLLHHKLVRNLSPTANNAQMLQELASRTYSQARPSTGPIEDQVLGGAELGILKCFFT